MTTSNEDIQLCARCGGQCCLTRPGIDDPQRFLTAPLPAAALADALASSDWVLESHLGIPYANGEVSPDPKRIIRYPRPATRIEQANGGRRPLPDHGPCVFLEPDGCRLPFPQRPRLCRELVPDVCFECESPWGRREAALAWLPHQPMVAEALRLLEQDHEADL